MSIGMRSTTGKGLDARKNLNVPRWMKATRRSTEMKENRRGKRWTEEENKTLAKLSLDGISLRKASVVLKRTKKAVMLQAAKLGLPLGRFAMRKRGRKHMQDELPLAFGEDGRKIPNAISETTTITVTSDSLKTGTIYRGRKKHKVDDSKKMWGLVSILMQISVIVMGVITMLAYYTENYQYIKNTSFPFWTMAIIAMLVMHIERNLASDK